jgi:hypothetical protein
VDVAVLADVLGPVALQSGGGLGQGLVEVAPHHRLERLRRPGRVGAGQEPGDLVGVHVPGVLGRPQLRLIAGLGRRHQIGRGQNVAPQQLGQLRPRLLPVVRLHGVADVGLVLQQPPRRRPGVRQTSHRTHDVQPRPLDVVLPQLPHGLANRHRVLPLRDRRRSGCLAGRCRLGPGGAGLVGRARCSEERQPGQERE